MDSGLAPQNSPPATRRSNAEQEKPAKKAGKNAKPADKSVEASGETPPQKGKGSKEIVEEFPSITMPSTRSKRLAKTNAAVGKATELSAEPAKPPAPPASSKAPRGTTLRSGLARSPTKPTPAHKSRAKPATSAKRGGAAAKAQDTMEAEESASRTSESSEFSSFLLSIPVNNNVFPDRRRFIDVRVNWEGYQIKDLQSEILRQVNAANRGKFAPRTLKYINVFNVKGTNKILPFKLDHIIERNDSIDCMIAAALARKTKKTPTPVVVAGNEGEAQEGPPMQGGPEGVHADAPPPLGGAHAVAAAEPGAVNAEVGPAGTPQGRVAPKNNPVKQLKAISKRFLAYLSLVAGRDEGGVSEAVAGTQAFDLMGEIEKLYPLVLRAQREGDFGILDETGLDGLASAINKSLEGLPVDVAFAKADDPYTLTRLAMVALGRRQTMKACSLVRNGPRRKPSALDKEKLGRLYPSRDTARDADASSSLPTLPASMLVDDREFSISREDFEQFLKNKPMATARGLNGPSWEHLKALAKDEEGADTLFRIAELLAPETLQRKFTPAENAVFLQARGIQIDKVSGAVRPIGIINTLFALAHALMLKAIHADVTAVCEPNLGFGIPGSAELAPRLLAKILLDPDSVALSLDVMNAFNSLEHDVLLRAILAAAEERPALRVLARHAFNMYAASGGTVKFSVTFQCPVDPMTKLVFHLTRGMIQGSVTGAPLFIIAVNWLLKSYRVAHPAALVSTIAFCDDHTLAGKVAFVLAAFADIRAAFAKGGLILQPAKLHVSGATMSDPAFRARFSAIGVVFKEDYVREQHDVIEICGTPIGHPTAVKAVLRAKIDNLIKSVRVLLEAVSGADKADFSVMQVLRILRVAVLPAAVHLARALEPDVSRPELVRLDVEVVRAVFAIMGREAFLRGSCENGDLARFLLASSSKDADISAGVAGLSTNTIHTVLRILTPQTLGGLGMASLAGLADSSFLGSELLTSHISSLLCPRLACAFNAEGVALPAPPDPPPADPGPFVFTRFVGDSMRAAKKAQSNIASLFAGGADAVDVVNNFLAANAIPSVVNTTKALKEMDLDAVPTEARRGMTQHFSRVIHHHAYLRLYLLLSEEDRISVKSASGTAASAWLRATLAQHRGRPANGINDADFVSCLKLLFNSPLDADAADPGKAAAAIPCTKCGREMTQHHAFSCMMRTQTAVKHNCVVNNLLKLGRRAHHGGSVNVTVEPSVVSVFPNQKKNPNVTPDAYSTLRADIAVTQWTGKVETVVDVKTNAIMAGRFRIRDPNHVNSIVSGAEEKAIREANAGLGPIPVGDRLRNWLPGTGPYAGQMTTSGFVGEAAKILHYSQLCDGIVWKDFFAFSIDVGGVINPRGRDLIQMWSRMAADNAAERGASPKKWWEIADDAITDISTGLQRANAKILQSAFVLAKREAARHSSPGGALGQPLTRFATVSTVAQSRRLVPGAIWRALEKPVTKTVSRSARRAAVAAGGVAAGEEAAVGGGGDI